jgi:hypothetical protein
VATIHVRGLRELQAAFLKLSPELRKELRKELKEAGEVVRREAVSLWDEDPRISAGYKVRVRARGVAVEQSQGRTTGRRPDFGALQMRTALSPALDAKTDQVVVGLELMLDRLGGSAGF